MAMIPAPSGQNLSATVATDNTGRAVMELTRFMVATGLWERAAQGDGAAVFSTGTADIFSANGGLGYTTSGAWNTGGANSFSNARAHVRLREKTAGGSPTGREIVFQRGTGTTAGTDRNLCISFAWTGFTGSEDTVTAAATSTNSRMVCGSALNGAGGNFWVHLNTSPQIGGAGGPIVLNYWVCDESSTGDVAPFGLVGYDSGADEAAVCLFYEALYDAAVADDHPCAVFAIATSGVAWEAGEAVSALPDYWTATNQRLLTADGLAAGERINPPDAQSRPGTGGLVFGADADGNQPIYPLTVIVDTVPNVVKGCCESIEQNFPASLDYMFPHTFHASVADPVEPPRLSLGYLTVPWLVGVTPTGITSNNRTDVRRYKATSTPDSGEPELGTVDPSSGSEIDPEDSVTLPFSDAVGLATVTVCATYADLGYPRTEAVYAGGAFFPPYEGTDDSTETELELVISRDPGWPADVVLTWVAVDGAGNVATGTVPYTLSSYLPSSAASP